MEYPCCVIWYLNIESETLKQQPTLTLFMQFWDFWWVSSVQYEIQCGLSNCDQYEKWIQTASHCNGAVQFTLRLVFSGDVVVFRCACRSWEWDCDEIAWLRGTGFRCGEFDVCYPDWRPGPSTGCGTPDDPNCKALVNKQLVTIKTRKWGNTCSDTKGDCTPCWTWIVPWSAS